MNTENDLEQSRVIDQHYYYVARFVLEAASAFAVASGLEDGAYNNMVVRDANGLPAIPGTSLAGVLRYLYHNRLKINDQRSQTLPPENDVFGTADRTSGTRSRLNVSWGCVHDSADRPLEGLAPIGFVDTDRVLERLAVDHAQYRHGVSIDEHGVAMDKFKYDKTVMPKGCRFSFEVSMWSENCAAPEWDMLLELLHSDELCLGGTTRGGLGRFTMTQLFTDVYDMEKAADFERFTTLPTRLGDSQYDQKRLSAIPKTSMRDSLTINLTPEDFWRVGAGDMPLGNSSRTPRALPLSESYIDWAQSPADFSVRKLVVPGTGLKGALRHRTLYHYRRLQGIFADEDGKVHDTTNDHSLDDLNTVFGFAADTDEGKSIGQASLISVDDVYIEQDERRDGTGFAHTTNTSNDRFAGGVRAGALYSEEVVWNTPFKLTIRIETSVLKSLDNAKAIMDAFDHTIADLKHGRLAFGASANKGHGYFRSTDADIGETIMGITGLSQ